MESTRYSFLVIKVSGTDKVGPELRDRIRSLLNEAGLQPQTVNHTGLESSFELILVVQSNKKAHVVREKIQDLLQETFKSRPMVFLTE